MPGSRLSVDEADRASIAHEPGAPQDVWRRPVALRDRWRRDGPSRTRSGHPPAASRPSVEIADGVTDPFAEFVGDGSASKSAVCLQCLRLEREIARCRLGVDEGDGLTSSFSRARQAVSRARRWECGSPSPCMGRLLRLRRALGPRRDSPVLAATMTERPIIPELGLGSVGAVLKAERRPVGDPDHSA